MREVVDQSQFVVDEDVRSELSNTQNFTGYAKGGTEVDPRSSECVAKVGYDSATDSYQHFVKFGTKGAEGGRMYNHMSPTFDSVRANRIYNSTGNPHYKFRRVSKEAFDAYLVFLRTNNPSRLRQAERI